MDFRSLLLTVQFLITGSLIAQSWCPPGATWVYRYDGWGVDYRTEYRYTNDTIIEGLVAKKVLVTTVGTAGGGQPIMGSGIEFTAWEDSILWVWGGANGWDTLYWPGAQPGERWWPIGHPQSCPPEGMLEILGSDSVEVDGVTLLRWQLGQVGPEGEVGAFGYFTERLGATPRHPFIFDCNLVIDYYFPHFVCYSDEEIQVPAGEDCHISLNVVDHGTSARLRVQPNPGNSFFQLTGLGDRTAQLRIFDLQGRVALELQHVTEQQPIDANGLRIGVYLIEIKNETNGRQVLRWVKEQ